MAEGANGLDVAGEEVMDNRFVRRSQQPIFGPYLAGFFPPSLEEDVFAGKKFVVGQPQVIVGAVEDVKVGGQGSRADKAGAINLRLRRRRNGRGGRSFLGLRLGWGGLLGWRWGSFLGACSRGSDHKKEKHSRQKENSANHRGSSPPAPDWRV